MRIRTSIVPAPNATASDDDAIATFPPDSRHYRVSGFAESVRNDPSPKGKGRHHNMVAALNVGEQSVTNYGVHLFGPASLGTKTQVPPGPALKRPPTGGFPGITTAGVH